jgi:ATP-dependent helicase/nuclease subunit A
MLFLENLRLLYVAATRAESRLVVSVVRQDRKDGLPDDPTKMTRAELFATASEGAPHLVVTTTPEAVRPLPATPATVAPPMPWEEWATLRTSAQGAASLREADSATDIAKGGAPLPEGLEIPPGLLKEPRDLELPAWLKGRYGAAIGRAVHATLQTVDLVTGEGLDGIADAQALAESVTDRVADVRALARSGWEAPSVRRAAEREHHKETYVGTTIGGQLVEGYIDLLYRDDDGSLVVIDYKTDADPSPQTVLAYQTQLAVYARALADATNTPISRCVLVFCREDGAVERDVPLPA